MKRWAGGIALLFLVACGEGPPPPAPKLPVTEAKPSPDVPAEAKPQEPKPAEVAAKKGPVDKKGRSKSPELFRKFMAIMDENGELAESIEEDVKNKRYESAIKPKIVRIRKNGEAARELHYRKDEDDDAALSNDFNLFLLKMKKFEESTWDETNSRDLLENLNGRCSTCHDMFQ